MRTSSVVALAGLLVALPSTVAEAAPLDDPASAITGEVVSARGRFTADRTTILTDAVIRTDDGRDIAVVQLGGRADGFGQRTIPSPPLLADHPGGRVTIRVRGTQLRETSARRARPVLVVEHVTVDADRAGFVRTGPTEAGNYLAWASGCVFLTYHPDGTADLAGDAEFTALDGALTTWNQAVDGCSYLTLMTSARRAAAVGHDGINLVIFRDDLWCRPATDDKPETCLPSGAAGLTTVTYVDDVDSSRDGEIVDADVELNGEEFAISLSGSSQGEPPCLSDLANTFTHELGHVMGLDHTCLAAGDDPKVDGNGDPVPLCSQTDDPGITEATMYNFQDCGEIQKITPEDDDVDAVCRAYPRDSDPGSCAPVTEDPGCCSAGGSGAGGPGGALLLTWALAAVAYRRRRSG